MDAHIHQAVLDPPGDLRALGKLAGDVASERLRRDRPMWEMWLVTGLEHGRTAIVCKVHHALLDGTSGLGSLAAFFDLEPHGQPVPVAPVPRRPPLSGVQLVAESLDAGARWRREFSQASSRIGDLVRFVTRHTDDPDRNPDLALPFSTPRLTMNGALTSRRCVEFTSIELSRLKPIRRALDITLNDLLVAICAGALRSYLIHKDELPDRPLVAAIPVSERELGEAPEGNRFSSMFYNLPVQIEDPMERVRATVRSAVTGRDAYQQVGRHSLQALASLAPPRTLGPAMRLVSSLRLGDVAPPFTNLMISNVRGTDFPLWVAGGKVLDMLPMGPLLEGSGLNITVASYMDSVGFGFQVCPDLVPDYELLVDGVHEALIEIEKVAPSTANLAS